MCKIKHTVIFIITFLSLTNADKDFGKYTFPKTFKFGVTTTAYGIEGAWNEDGKSESILDEYYHNNYNASADHSNGDIAADSYHRYEEDVNIVKELGVDFYKFSISWSRLIPNHSLTIQEVNPKAVEYYNNLINKLKENKIEPMVVLGADSIPINLYKEVNFTNSQFINIYENYAKTLFKLFGDRVKYWITFDQPQDLCAEQNYDLNFVCGHVILKAHASVYRLYEKEFKKTQRGKVSIALGVHWFEQASKLREDKLAAEKMMELLVGWFANPIYSTSGDYSKLFKSLIENARIKSNDSVSTLTLPVFSKEEIAFIRGTSDFFSMNFITTFLVKNDVNKSNSNNVLAKYSDAIWWQDPKWGNSTTNAVIKCTPWALRSVLKWVKYAYNNPDVFITGHGWSDSGKLYDLDRIKHLVSYLSEMLDAIKVDNVKVRAYFVRSLLDGFSGSNGYLEKDGLYQVDFNDPTRKRQPKSSSNVYKEIIKNRKLPSKFCD